jgi:radical SAM protein with 4Fe4S-binding SPASM domain
MCPQSKGLKRKKMTMGMDAFVHIIDQIYMDKPKITLHMSGEPLFNENLCEMIEYAKRRSCWVGMHTNATLLTEEMSIRILKTSLDFISFSFDGCTPEVYEKVRVGANFDQIKSQIETFLRLRYEMRRKAPYIQIEIIKMNETAKYIPDFIKYWQTKELDRVVVRPLVTWCGLVDDLGAENSGNFGYRPCTEIFYKCAILVDGTVVSCCMDLEGRLPLGNIFKQPFNEIWNGALYNQLRTQHLKNTIPENSICQGCIFTQNWSKSEQITQWILRQFFYRKTPYYENLG